MSVVGLGIDLCAIPRIQKILASARGERFVARVYTDAERDYCSRRVDQATAYASRFAAKEALVKALGAPEGITWHDMEVLPATGGPPTFRLSGVAQREVARRGSTPMLALSHDADVAVAAVVLVAARPERRRRVPPARKPAVSRTSPGRRRTGPVRRRRRP